jgi:signal transduction histidine kinase
MSYVLAFSAIIFYFFVYKNYSTNLFDIFLNVGLNGFAFFIIALAGIKLNKKLEEQLKYIKFLEQERGKSELYRKVYSMSTELAHEIRNPLASISAASQLLREGNVNKSLLEVIYKESQRVDSILKSFIQFSKPSKNNKEKFNLIFLIEDIVKNSNLGHKKFSLDYENVFKIKTDRSLLESALSNIIRNSFEWAKSKVSIKVYKIRNDLLIDIEDDGEGIPDEEIDKIFEPFYTKRKKGTGLGLAIAKRNLLEINGDVLVFKSKLGGAGFKVILKDVEVCDESIGS